MRTAYDGLWAELTASMEYALGERYLVDARIRRLNDLGFDVAELHVEPQSGRSTVRVAPKVVGAVPRALRGKLEPAQVFHEVLEHRWFMSERAGRDVGPTPAIDDHVAKVLSAKRDEAALLGPAVADGG